MNDDDTTAGEANYDVEEITCEECGGALTRNAFTYEYWGFQCTQDEYKCENCD